MKQKPLKIPAEPEPVPPPPPAPVASAETSDGSKALSSTESTTLQENLAKQNELTMTLGIIEMTLADFTSQKNQTIQAIAKISSENQKLLKGALIARGIPEADAGKWMIDLQSSTLKLKG